ncbi:Hypothetical protein DPCES_0958 [Desulfitobacterium hafniense]|uniref:Uncharacterized protein n=1 Tax=Desulfitobacterium hafniense TaxID=49338 RepID=A0A098AXK2_DESHA|nr:hypothetical protein [Desulfitobacterium hafniense]CDX00845.1 Hypothetical protein DPCES_0958 [Desulfitobacterium hafniense]
MYLDPHLVKKTESQLLNIKHQTLNQFVIFLKNGNARLNPEIIPKSGAVYIFWWTGDKSIFNDPKVNRTLRFKGPKERPVDITYTDDWLFHRGVGNPIPLYVGKTADNLSNRIGLHLQLGTVRVLGLGQQALEEKRKTTSNQVRDRIERMFINVRDTRELILNNIGLSYTILDGDEQSVNRFYLEDKMIGELFPLFNVDIER